MKNTILLCAVILAFVFSSTTPGPVNQDLYFEVNKNYPAVSISTDQLKDVQTLLDLNNRYPSDWVREYLSVEIITLHQGNEKRSLGANDQLTEEQMTQLKAADLDSKIRVNVSYIPENNLKHNEPKEIEFTFTIEPEIDANFPGGESLRDRYLKEQAIQKIPATSFQGYDMAAIKFTVNEDGQVSEAHIFIHSKNEEIDELLLETICNMPSWEPARFVEGPAVEQEYAFAVGNMESCKINMLNLRRGK